MCNRQVTEVAWRRKENRGLSREAIKHRRSSQDADAETQTRPGQVERMEKVRVKECEDGGW